MADEIEYVIRGHDTQIIEIELDPGEAVRAEVGAMTYMSQAIEMETGTGGGLFSGLKRMLSGESFFITTFIHAGQAGKGQVAFAAPYPGKILPLDLSQSDYLCQKDAFLCAANGIDISVAFTKKLGAGLFGGEGFILQKMSGNGLAFIHSGGTVVRKQLVKGEKMFVDVGCLTGFSKSVSYDIKFVGGFRNVLFGGEGLYLAEVEGPGEVLIQSLPFSRLVDRIIAVAQLGGQRKE